MGSSVFQLPVFQVARYLLTINQRINIEAHRMLGVGDGVLLNFVFLNMLYSKGDVY